MFSSAFSCVFAVPMTSGYCETDIFFTTKTKDLYICVQPLCNSALTCCYCVTFTQRSNQQPQHCQTVCMMRIQMIRLLLVIFFMHLHVTSNKLKQETQLLRALMKTTPLLLATCSYQETYFTPLLARKKFRKRGNKDGL